MGEYMSLGRPTVANPVGDIKYLFEQHPVGLLASWEAEDFAEKILQLLSNPQQAAELGTSARKVAESKYDWRILTERLEKFYQKILAFESRQSLANPLLEGDIYGPF
jgi:glycosyltransferase involved in cell wall biosynthesis